MTKKVKGIVWLLLLIAALGVTAVGFAFTHVKRRGSISNATPEKRQSVSNVSKGSRKEYVRRGLLAPRLAPHLNALGDRLEKRGKERLTFTGVLRLAADSQPRQIGATLEFPDRIRVVLQNGPQNRLLTFDGDETKAGSVPPANDELDLIETLAYDSAEHFFAAQTQGSAMRFLGTRFRTDDGSAADYDGPYYDVYKIGDQVKASGQERLAKLYYFNSDTLLLERVTYVINRDGSEVNVETKLSDWRELEGQQVARRIERFENGKSVLLINIRSAQFGRRTDDGIFTQ